MNVNMQKCIGYFLFFHIKGVEVAIKKTNEKVKEESDG